MICSFLKKKKRIVVVIKSDMATYMYIIGSFGWHNMIQKVLSHLHLNLQAENDGNKHLGQFH